MHAHSPSRSRPRAASVLSVAAPAPMAGAVRPVVDPLSPLLSAESRQPPLRLPPAAVVRAEPPGRGFCRDVRGVAYAALELAQALCRLAGFEEAAICRRADGRDRRGEARAHAPAACRPVEPAHADAGRTLRKQTRPIRHCLSEGIDTGSLVH